MKMGVRRSREMRLLDITMTGVGAMMGAGILVLTGIAAGVAGPALIVAFAMAVGLGSAKDFPRGLESLFEKKDRQP